MKRMVALLVALFVMSSSAFATFGEEDMALGAVPRVYLGENPEITKGGGYEIPVYGEGLAGYVSFDIALRFDGSVYVSEVAFAPYLVATSWLTSATVQEPNWLSVSAAGAVAIPDNGRTLLCTITVSPYDNGVDTMAVIVLAGVNDSELDKVEQTVNFSRLIDVRITGDGKVIHSGYAIRVGQDAQLVPQEEGVPLAMTITLEGGGDEGQLTETPAPADWLPKFVEVVNPWRTDIHGWGGWVTDLSYPTATRIVVEVKSFGFRLHAIDGGGAEIEMPRVFIYPMLGDVDGYGVLTIADAILVIRHTIAFTAAQRIAGELSGNGVVNAYDAALILAMMGGIITEFPIVAYGPQIGAPQRLASEPSSEELIRQLQKESPDLLAQFEKAGGSIYALRGITAQGKLATNWAAMKIAQ